VTTYAEIAAWSEADLDAIDARLGAFAGRPRRDNWVEQCRFLSIDDRAGYEGKFGKL
jgi:predicted flap endonuclease-1-like 5' DNA nuclease